MAKQPAIKADWQTLDPETLPEAVRKQYLRYKESYKEMKMDRDAFEQAMRDQAEAPQGKRLVFGYNFGKLSVALVDDTGTTVTSAKPALSLSAFLAGQTAQGKRT